MKKHWKKIVLLGLILASLWLVVGFLVSRYWLKLTSYDLQSEKLTASVRIVQLSDLHSTDYGEDLLDMVRAQEPDLIFFTGDLINLWDEDLSVSSNPFEHRDVMLYTDYMLRNPHTERKTIHCSNRYFTTLL